MKFGFVLKFQVIIRLLRLKVNTNRFRLTTELRETFENV